MADVDNVLTLLERAGEFPVVLDAAWDAFGVLLAGCRQGQEQSVELFAAFAFAAAAAAEGRLLIGSAPSAPAARSTQASDVACVIADPDTAADALAGLAQMVSQRLASASRSASPGGDRDACLEAAARAAQIQNLLARGGLWP